MKVVAETDAAGAADPGTRTGSGSVLAAAVLLSVVMVGTTAPNALWPLFQDRLGISTTAVTLVFASYAMAVTAALVAFGAASDRIGRRPVLAAAVTVSAASSLVTLGDGVGALVAGRVLSGVSVGLVSGAAAAYITELRPGAGPARGALVATAATMAGLAAGPLMAAAVVEIGSQGTRGPFLVHLVLLVPALVALRGPETVTRVSGGLRVRRPAIPAARVRFAGAALTGFAANAQLGLYAALAPTFLADALGRDGILLGGAVGALLFAVAGISQVTTRALAPTTIVRVGAGVLALGSVVLVAALTLESLGAFLVATAVGGAAGGLGFSGGLGLAGDLADDRRRSAVTSTWFIATYLGLVGPVIGAGRLVDTVGATNAAILFGAAITAVGVTAATLASR